MQGHLIIISGPSGSGKTTAINGLLKIMPNHLQNTVSCTTRDKRYNEQNGREYHFLSRNTFNQYIEEGKFIEYAEVSGNMYGTLKTSLLEALQDGKNIIMDIDYQGAFIIKDLSVQNNINLTTIFISQDLTTLHQRLVERDDIHSQDILHRIETAKTELKQMKYYDYCIENKIISETIEKIKCIIEDVIQPG